MQHYSDVCKLSLVLAFSQKIFNLGFVSWIPTELFISFTMVTSLFAFWTDLALSLVAGEALGARGPRRAGGSQA